MNDSSLDRDLRDLFAAGPQEAPPTVVERALAGARRDQQRRPRFTLLDTRAWPPQPRSVADPTVHRALRVLAVAALVVVLGVVIVVGARLLDRPPSVTIVSAGTLDAVVSGPRLALWPDGRILVEGQNGARYLFDPATGATEALRFGSGWNLAQATVLPDGSVVLTRSIETANGRQGSIEVARYERATGAVEPVGSFETPWFASATLVLRDGRVLISGGVVFPNTDPPCSPLTCEGPPTPAPTPTYDTAEGAKDTVRLFDSASGRTTEIGHLQVARFQHQMLELEDGRILVIGGGDYGTDATGNSEALEVEVYDLATGASKVVGSLKPGRMPFSFPPVALDDGRILIPEATIAEFPCGIPSFTPGEPVYPEDVRTTYRQPLRLFDLATDRLIDGPTLPHHLGGSIVPLRDGRALAFGIYQVFLADCAIKPASGTNPWLGIVDLGRNTVFETYDPMTGVTSLEVNATRVYGAGILLPDGRHILF